MGYAIPAVGSLTSSYMVALGHIWASAHPYRDMAWLVAVCGLLAARVGGRGEQDSTTMVRKRAIRGGALELIRSVQRFVDTKFIDDD